MAASSVLKDDEKYLTMERSVISLTFRESVENHVGMQQLGERVQKGEGLSLDELRDIKKDLEERRFAHISDISKKIRLFNFKSILEKHEALNLPEDAVIPEAGLLIIKGGVDLLFGEGYADKLFQEQTTLETDKKMFAYGRVVDKNIRHNLCFADKSQTADFPNKKGTIISFNDGQIPFLKRVREEFGNLHPKLSMLFAEGNYYYDKEKCAIRYHGDTEARKVICVRLGADFPISFQWFHGAMGGKPFGDPIESILQHGDIYIMSEEAVGTEWTNKTNEYKNRFTLRHAAGFKHLIAIKPKKKNMLLREGYVLNPKSGKQIKIGGATHKKLLAETK
jgi:hypothetical protein